MAKVLSIPPTHVGPIVLVDDEVELVRAVGGMLRAELGDTRVRATSDSQEASGWIQAEQPSVLITDVRMPGMSGLELISQVRKTWGPTPTVVITAFPTEDVSVGARRGAFVYLPKPFSFSSLLDTVQQLLSAPASSFRGAVAVSTLADILQLYAISGGTGMMAVSSSDRRGEIWFERGQITHARTAEAEGFEAFCELLAWPKGSFSWHPRRSDRQTIQMSVSTLMLEAYRIHDEALRDAHQTVRPPKPEPASDFSLEDEAAAFDGADVARFSAAVGAPGLPDLPPMVEPEPRRGPPSINPLSSIQSVLGALGRLDGFLGVALVDVERETPLGVLASGIDVGTAVAGYTELLAIKRATLKRLGVRDEIEDILVMLGTQYHLIRPLRTRPWVYFYLALDREQASLAMARLQLADAERELVL